LDLLLEFVYVDFYYNLANKLLWHCGISAFITNFLFLFIQFAKIILL